MTKNENRAVLAVLALICALLLAGCSIHASKSGDDKNKDVDIRSPFGSISVHAGQTDVKELGLPVYPGARPTRGNGDDDNANVNITSPFGGVKVVVHKFESVDSPDKVLDF